MGDLVEGDDGLPAEEVGSWAIQKQELLCRYVDISRGVRRQFIGLSKAGATYIDLFCGPGRSKIKDGPFIDGSCVAAWKKSVEGGAPFSRMFIADADDARLNASIERLKKLGAPVSATHGRAIDTVQSLLDQLEPTGLHFAFLDPYSVGALDFAIIRALAGRKRMDMLVHLSKMDLQRNLGANLAAENSAFDAFAPGWKNAISYDQGQRGIRSELVDYWKALISKLGTSASPDMKLLKGDNQQHLYWLLLLASHDLAHRFWKAAANTEKQGSFNF